MIKVKTKLQIIFYILFFLIGYSDPVLAQVVRYNGRNYRDPLKIPLELMKPIKIEKVEEVGEKEEVKFEEEIILPEFKLQGILWGGKRPQAIINDRVFDKGMVIDEAEIINIDKEGVIFLYKNKKFIVRPQVKGRRIGGR
jgi:hypothetical protein